MTALRTISDDTAILPDVIARAIVDDVARYTGLTLAQRLVYIQQLVTRAERLYMQSWSFRRKIRGAGNHGRDYCYTFMRHWYAGLLMDNEPATVTQLKTAGVWHAFANGQALPEVSNARD